MPARFYVVCSSLSNLLEELSKDAAFSVEGEQEVYIQCEDESNARDQLGPHEASTLASALQSFTRASNVKLFLKHLRFGEVWGVVFNGLASNPRFTGWVLKENEIHDAQALVLARCLEGLSWVRTVNVLRNPLSAHALAQIAHASFMCSSLHSLKLVQSVETELTAELLEACMCVRKRNPKVKLGYPPQVLRLDSMLATMSITNPDTEEVVRELHKSLLSSAVWGNDEEAENTRRKLIDEVARPEHERLVSLMPVFMAKYAAIGGFELFAILPAPFDEYAVDNRQFTTQAMKKKPDTVQVRCLLGMAHYKQVVLEEIAKSVHRELEILNFGVSVEVNRLLPEFVDVFLSNFGLTDEAARMPLISIDGDVDSSVKGSYVFVGYQFGAPAFGKVDPRAIWESGVSTDACYMYLYLREKGDGWLLNKRLGEAVCMYMIRTGKGSTGLNDLLAATKAITTGVNQEHTIRFSKGTCQRTLRQGLLDFLSRRSADKGFREILGQSQQFLSSLVFGPMKDVVRAEQKGPVWLLDTNRCSFVVDSPVLLVVIFKLLEKKVKALGGRIARYSNYFLSCHDFENKGGLLALEMNQPPCMKVNFQLDGWTYEVMLLLTDFSSIKQAMHPFYEIKRSECVDDALVPVFKPDIDIDDIERVAAFRKFRSSRQVNNIDDIERVAAFSKLRSSRELNNKVRHKEDNNES